LVQRPLPDELLQSAPKRDALLQGYHVECAFNVSNPVIILKSVAYQVARTGSSTHNHAEVGCQTLDGRVIEPPIPPEQHTSTITNLDGGRGIEHGVN
jgi:hypothetical protein